MPLDPEFWRQLAQLPVLALVLFGLGLVVVGLHRQWWVPGWVYRQEREARLIAETQATRNAEALQKLARAVTRERGVPAGGKVAPDADA